MPPSESPLLGRRLETGAMVGEYQVTEVLEEGGMGRIYAAVHPVIGKTVAIKVLAAFLSHDEGMTQRFIQEARAVNQIKHANIVDIFGFGRLPDGRLYYLMELLAGQSLKARRQEPTPLRYEETLSILAQVCDALAAAHAEGIIHRDLKPDNIFLVKGTDLRTVKLLDFGIAKLLHTADEAENKTEAGLLMGTPRYMSPEQCLSRELDPRTDIYALGVIMFELFTGRLPFTGSSIEVINAHLSQPPPVPRELAPSVPQDLNDLILRCLAKDPADRPASVAEVRERLLEISISQALGLDAGLPAIDVSQKLPLPKPAQTGSVTALADQPPASPAAGKPSDRSPRAATRPGGLRPRPVHYAIAAVVLLLAAFGLFMAVDRLRGGDRAEPPAAATAGDPGEVALQIVSEPPGATVYFDGVRQELLTPYVYKRPPQGEFKVRVELAGHRPHEEVVTLAEGQREKAVKVTLVPAGAGVDAGAPAAGDSGREDDQKTGKPPVITALRLRSNAVTVGKRNSLSADIDFTDPDGDVEAAMVEVSSPSRRSRPQRIRVSVRGVTAGTVAFTFVVNPARVEPYQVAVRLVDRGGKASGLLRETLEVSGTAPPAPDTPVDAGMTAPPIPTP